MAYFLVSLLGRFFAKNADMARVHFWVYLLVTGSCSLFLDSYVFLLLFRKKQLHVWLSFSPGLYALDSLPCLLFLICLRNTFKPDKRKFKDPTRLYAPGRMYHIVVVKSTILILLLNKLSMYFFMAYLDCNIFYIVTK